MGIDQAVRITRDDPVAGTLSRAIFAALAIRDQMRADGASDAECAAALEEAVRRHWPFTREWKYLCGLCDDTGLRLERRKHALYGETWIDVGVPCACSLGVRFIPKRKGGDDDFTAAGKVKASKPTRWGRS